MSFTKNQFYAGLIVDVMVLLIVAAFIWPLQQNKNVQYDNQTSMDLAEIATEIDSYFISNASLPQTLNEVDLDSDISERVTTRGYEYTKLSYDGFELCSEFKTSSQTSGDTYIGNPLPLSFGFPEGGGFPPRVSSDTDTYIHTTGRNCFTFTVNSFFEQTSDSFEDQFTIPDFPTEEEASELLELFNISPSDL